MAKKCLAVSGSKSGEAVGNGGLEFSERAGRGLPQLGLEFGKSHFNGIEIGAVSREVSDSGAFGRNQLGDAGDFVGGEVVEDDDVVLLEFWTQNLAQVSGEDFGVHRAFDEEGSRQAVAAKCGDKGRSLPMTVRHGCHAALVPQRAAVKAGHLRVEPGLVDEDQPRAVPMGLERAPVLTRGFHVRACLLGGVRGFFYSSDPGDRVDATAP